jgi:hypothetical protein
MAEIELSVLPRQCLNGRIPDQDTLINKVTAWENRRNGMGASVRWRFTTDDARIKLHRLYLTINVGKTTKCNQISFVGQFGKLPS